MMAVGLQMAYDEACKLLGANIVQNSLVMKELLRMKEQYEPDDTADNSVEVVHGGNGAADNNGSSPPAAGSGEGGSSGSNGSFFPTLTAEP